MWLPLPAGDRGVVVRSKWAPHDEVNPIAKSMMAVSIVSGGGSKDQDPVDRLTDRCYYPDSQERPTQPGALGTRAQIGKAVRIRCGGATVTG